MQPQSLTMQSCWFDDDVINAKDEAGDASFNSLQQLLDAAVSAIETSSHEMSRVRSIISDLERYVGRPLDAQSMPDLAVYDQLDQGSTLKYNVCFSAVDTIVSRVCSFRPRAQFLPEFGNYKTHRLARNLTSASDAWCQQQEYQSAAANAFKDGLVGPGGVLKVYLEDGAPELMRVPSHEIKLDEQDWKYNAGECLYHVRYVTLNQALRTYGDTPEARDAIAIGATRLATITGFEKFTTRGDNLMCRVVDAYHRGPNGRHVIMAGDYVHTNEAWEHDGFPFVFFKFKDRQQGPWGHSAISFIRSIQDRVDAHLYKIDQAHHLAASLIVVSKDIPPEFVTNEIVQHIPLPTPESRVQLFNPQAVEPGTYRWWEILKEMAFEELGVSKMAAEATKAPGVTAAVAVEAVSDLQTDRLSQLSHTWEQAVTKVGDWWYALSADAGAGGKEYVAVDRGRSKIIKFEKGERKPSIRTLPSTLFGQSVPARLQKAMDAVKAGWIDKEDALKALDVPQLDGTLDLQLAEFYFIENYVDGILEDGVYETIDEWASVIKAFEYARKRYLLARADGSYPEANMKLMRKLLDYLQPKAQEARDKASGKAPAAAPAPANDNAAALAPPMPSPQALIAPPSPIDAPPLPGLGQTPEAPLAA